MACSVIIWKYVDSMLTTWDLSHFNVISDSELWALFQIALDGSLDEMLVAYAREAKSQGLLPTLGGLSSRWGQQRTPEFSSALCAAVFVGAEAIPRGGQNRQLHIRPIFFYFTIDCYFTRSCTSGTGRCWWKCPKEVRLTMLLSDNVAFSENGQAYKQQGEKEILLKLILGCQR